MNVSYNEINSRAKTFAAAAALGSELLLMLRQQRFSFDNSATSNQTNIIRCRL